MQKHHRHTQTQTQTHRDSYNYSNVIVAFSKNTTIIESKPMSCQCLNALTLLVKLTSCQCVSVLTLLVILVGKSLYIFSCFSSFDHAGSLSTNNNQDKRINEKKVEKLEKHVCLTGITCISLPGPILYLSEWLWITKH